MLVRSLRLYFRLAGDKANLLYHLRRLLLFAWLGPQLLMEREPAQQTTFKFLVSGSPYHGMTGVRHQPELHMIGCGSGYQL